MDTPNNDLQDRKPVWAALQHTWMDIEPSSTLDDTVKVCAESKYSLTELEAIYWNEVRPATCSNITMFPAPEQAVYDIEWLKERVLEKHRYGKRLPVKWMDPFSNRWWRRVREGVRKWRGEMVASNK